jgi:hypothetical protein
MGKKNQLHLSFLRGKDLVTLYPQLQQKGRVMAASICFGSKKDFNKERDSRVDYHCSYLAKRSLRTRRRLLEKKLERPDLYSSHKIFNSLLGIV